MDIVRTPADACRTLATRRGTQSIALVPTMGCLHKGHMELIKTARQQADIVVVSIYVNPLQFGVNEDLDRYPRTFTADADHCEQAGVDMIFHPHTLYADGGPQVSLQVGKLADILCGAHRPGHFDGVATVVNILLNIIRPDLALFGEKDWQQLTIIRHMVHDLHMPVRIIGVPTVREPDGLAMSSRNRYLDAVERKRSVTLSQALHVMARQAASGTRNCRQLLDAGLAVLQAQGITPEYLDIRHADTLQTLNELIPGKPARALVAARIGKARLIDNMPLDLMEAHS